MTVSASINLFTSNETANGVTINLGGSPTLSDEIFLEGSGSLGDRVTSTAGLSGFLCLDDGPTLQDMSSAGTHVGMWLYVSVYSILNQLQMVMSNTTATSGGGSAGNNYAGMALTPSSDYPQLGGWYRIWADTSLFNSPDTTVGSWTSGDISTVGAVGAAVEFTTAPGGSTSNVIIDAIHFTNGSNPVLIATSTGNTFATFSTADDITTAGSGQFGAFKLLNGVYQCLSRIALSDTNATTFSDSGFTIIFPNQPLVASNYMGINVDLSNASTSVSLTSGNITSVGTSKGDLVASGTSGALTITDTSLIDLRQVTLTSSCEVSGGTLDAADLTQGSAHIHDGIIKPRTASNVALCDDATFGTSTGIHDVTVSQAGSGHAFEFSTGGNRTLTGITFSNFGGTPGTNLTENSGASNAAIVNSSGTAITITISGGGNQPSIRNVNTGSTTTVEAKTQVTLTNLVNGTEVRVYDAGTNVEIAGVELVTGNSFSFQDDSGNVVYIRIFKEDYRPADFDSYTIPASDISIPVSQVFDRNFTNPDP